MNAVNGISGVEAVTANAMPLDVTRGIKAGFFRSVTKPIQVTEFMDVLDVALEYAQSRVSLDT